MRGSSPLARGTLGCDAGHAAAVGLIPARAGNTWLVRVTLRTFSAHPRSRGEHAPPRDWGAGCGAHPRSRGEHSPVATSTFSGVGSSPLARGTQQKTHPGRGGSGLIPARAGNTGAHLPARGGDLAHPRSRGEHRPRGIPPPIPHGSSPLARGTRGCDLAVEVSAGLIPARAGNTAENSTAKPGNGAHPRSRGEHAQRNGLDSSAEGSSPLARGTRCRT